MSRIALRHRPGDAAEFATAADRIRHDLLARAVDPARGCLVGDYGGTEMDASLLQAVTLSFLPPGDARMQATVDAVHRDLEHHGWLRRYRTNDGFGVPQVAFMLCTFWSVEALARSGRVDEARAIMDRVREVRSPLGLLSEDVDPATGVMWGNFPQAYSHAGLIHGAFACAPRWAEFAS
jgi:GH15 family glucan-1,4-alpha-glucosidase